MATRSQIGILNEDGSIDAIYCHWDGYLSNNGTILVKNYTTESKVRELIALGSISLLGEEIGVQHNFDSGSKNWTKAYHRDRGDELRIRHSNNLEDFLKAREEYNYLFNPKTNQWFWCDWECQTPLPRLTLSVCNPEEESE